MRSIISRFLVLTPLFVATLLSPTAFAEPAASDQTVYDRPEDREIWVHLVRRLGLSEEQQKLLLRETAAFKQDVTPFLRQLEECSRILRRLKESDADPALIRRAERCILDSLTAIKRLFHGYVQAVSRILTEDQEFALRQAVEVLLVLFDINLPPLR